MGLVVEGVSKTYGSGANAVMALRDVSLRIELGEILAVLGNNGAGKSTLMSIAAGLRSADAGSVSVMGDETTARGGTPSSHLGIAPQEDAVYPTLTVRKNLTYFARLAGLGTSQQTTRVKEVARDLLLSELLDRKASELSGGQRRRLHTALALMHAPEVILLDEPTVGVDIEARRQILDFVTRTADSGAAIMYSTHQLAEVESLGASVAVIDEGRILARGTVSELVDAHAAPVAEYRFHGSQVSLPDRVNERVEKARTDSNGDLVIVARVESADTPIPELISELPESTRDMVQAIEVRAPSFEDAYLGITKKRPGEAAPSATSTRTESP